MKSKAILRAVLACILMPPIASSLLAAIVFLEPTATFGDYIFFWAAAAVGTYQAELMLGVPIYLIFGRKYLRNLRDFALFGSALAIPHAAIFTIISPDPRVALTLLPYGAIAGAMFWLLAIGRNQRR